MQNKNSLCISTVVFSYFCSSRLWSIFSKHQILLGWPRNVTLSLTLSCCLLLFGNTLTTPFFILISIFHSTSWWGNYCDSRSQVLQFWDWDHPCPHLYPQRHYGNIVNPSGYWFQLKGWGHQTSEFFWVSKSCFALVTPCTNRCSPLLVFPHSWDADERDSDWDQSEEDNTSCPVHSLVV